MNSSEKSFGFVYFIREISRCKNSVNPRTNLRDSINNRCLYSLLRISLSSQSSVHLYSAGRCLFSIKRWYIVIWTEFIICSLSTDETLIMNIFLSAHGHREITRWKPQRAVKVAHDFKHGADVRLRNVFRPRTRAFKYNSSRRQMTLSFQYRIRRIWSWDVFTSFYRLTTRAIHYLCDLFYILMTLI